MNASDQRVSPDIPALLGVLIEYEVGFILAGSVAVEAWGADAGMPGDLDIVPAMDRRNLARLATVLERVEAQPWPVTGQWVPGDGGDVRWEELADGDPRRDTPFSDPDPDDPGTFDSLFSTRFGELDIVPRISGTLEWLRPRAVELTVRGVDGVLVTHVDDMLGYLTVPRRKKDVARVATLRARQREAGTSR